MAKLGSKPMRKGTPLASRVAQGVSGPSSSCVWNPRVFADDARAPAACFFPGENAISWEALGEARPGQMQHSMADGPFHLPSQQWRVFLTSRHSDTDFCPLLHIQRTCDNNTGPTWIIQDNLFILTLPLATHMET